MRKAYIGIDNGVSGSIGIILSEDFIPTMRAIISIPTITEQNYTKKKYELRRIDRGSFNILLSTYTKDNMNALIIMERPMVNTMRFMQSISAARAYEAELCVIEELKIPIYRNGCIDSKEWQRVFFGNTTGSDNLKKASLSIGKTLFKDAIVQEGIKDYDSLFIAEWALKNRL